MGGFICVALIVIALLWCKIWPFIVDLHFEAIDAEGERQKQEKTEK